MPVCEFYKSFYLLIDFSHSKAYESNASLVGDLTERLEMDWSHYPQVTQQYYTTRLNLEPIDGERKRTTEKYVAPRSGNASKKLETFGDTDSGAECLTGNIMLAAYVP